MGSSPSKGKLCNIHGCITLGFKPVYMNILLISNGSEEVEPESLESEFGNLELLLIQDEELEIELPEL